MTVTLDCTQHSIVLVCTICGLAWRGFAFDKLDAWTRAAAHEERAHPDLRQARDALSTFRKRSRHAV